MAQRCSKYKRVRSKFGGTVRRCASFGGRSSNGRRKRRYRRKGMARRGGHCVRYKRVKVKGQGYARRCAKYAGGSRRRASGGRSRYRKGRRPFNKGKKCVRMGVNSRGKPVCRSYGSTSGWRSKSGRRRGGSVYGPARPTDAQSVAMAYRGQAQAGQRYGSAQRGWLKTLILGPG